ncbi:MAG: cation:proton antiporter [Spirochaetaceae bacterium]|nr:cation:proton antiporter [Spirochaetaceae bacterium]MDT8296825.1 cation:proton antiporter [Spirochaetaceae bacterium]
MTIPVFNGISEAMQIPMLLIVGVMSFFAFYSGKAMKPLRLPSLIGFMLIGAVLGPSFLGILDETVQHRLSFLTDIALSFVAVSIGLELKLTTLKRLGSGVITVIFSESLLTFFLVTTLVWLITRNLPMALIFGAIAPASAPAGTVAVIKEYKAKGPLTQTLYAVVGFDDGLGIIIFGFASAIARHLLVPAGEGGVLMLLAKPLMEIVLSLVVGLVLSAIYAFLTRKSESKRDQFLLLFAIVMMATGLSQLFHLSLILTNMVVGMVLVNTQRSSLLSQIHDSLADIMPLLFLLFFTLAGANLHIAELPALGLLGLVYILSRSSGLISGAWLGSSIGRLGKDIRNNLGLGILSQAGVAIGLALIVRNEFAELGPAGEAIGTTVITTISATSIIFELIGPITTKLALRRAGEISA